MAILFLVGVFVSYGAESAGNLALAPLGINQQANTLQAAATWRQGSPIRITTPHCLDNHHRHLGRPVNSMHDSYTPIGGLVPIVNMQLGEIIFGGVGCASMECSCSRSLGLHRRPDGRTNAGVSGEEDRVARSENGDARHLSVPLSALGFTAMRGHSRRIGRIDKHWAHGFSEIL